jgi:hypothetical protein
MLFLKKFLKNISSTLSIGKPKKIAAIQSRHDKKKVDRILFGSNPNTLRPQTLRTRGSHAYAGSERQARGGARVMTGHR